jgi:hypothetical protein
MDEGTSGSIVHGHDEALHCSNVISRPTSGSKGVPESTLGSLVFRIVATHEICHPVLPTVEHNAPTVAVHPLAIFSFLLLPVEVPRTMNW